MFIVKNIILIPLLFNRCWKTVNDVKMDMLKNKCSLWAAVAALLFVYTPAQTVAQTNAPAQPVTTTNAPALTSADLPDWLSRPLTLEECLNIALANNSDIKESQFDVESAIGQAITNRAIVIPKVVGKMGVNRVQDQYIERMPGSTLDVPTDSWTSSILVQQQFFKGGQMAASLKIARHLKEQAIYSHRAKIANVLTDVKTRYYDVLLALERIKVNEASVALLTKELEDSQRRFKAKTVPKFNVLRAEVQLANAQPPLIQARNDYRIAKNDLCNLLGYNIPRTVWEDIPLNLVGKLEAQPFEINLSEAMAQAIEKRPELGALRETEIIAQQGVRMAKGNYLPGIVGYGGYRSTSSSYKTDLTDIYHGWVIGGELNWSLFDGLMTKGAVDMAKARLSKTEEQLADTVRDIEVEVRSAYSSFIEAKETLESQEKNVELAEEALRLANALESAGSGTQLDVLDAETALTQARTTWVNALRNYSVSLANLERAIGITVQTTGEIETE